VRNLTASEIAGQLMVARDALGDWPSTGENRRVTNVVMMGMGEPLYNFENVKAALALVTDGDGLALSKRRVTLSTAGVVPMIARAGHEIGSSLAISLHAVRDEIRDVIVPINKKYPLKELLEACRTYPGVSNARRITFEYVMLKGINDSLADARELVKAIRGIPAKINLIPFNPWPGAPYECSDWEQIEKFAEVVNRAGYASPVRTPRGRDIMAACQADLLHTQGEALCLKVEPFCPTSRYFAASTSQTRCGTSKKGNSKSYISVECRSAVRAMSRVGNGRNTSARKSARVVASWNIWAMS